MRAVLSHIDWQAIFLALIAGYSVPILMACTMNNSAWSLWFWVITPLISGYVVAKLAVKIPLMHGLFTSFCSLLVVTALAHPNGVGAWFAIVIMNISFSIFGAWLWRLYSQKAI